MFAKRFALSLQTSANSEVRGKCFCGRGRHNIDVYKVIWKTPAYQSVMQILHSPIYAGAYAFGRGMQRKRIIDGRARTRSGLKATSGMVAPHSRQSPQRYQLRVRTARNASVRSAKRDRRAPMPCVSVSKVGRHFALVARQCDKARPTGLSQRRRRSAEDSNAKESLDMTHSTLQPIAVDPIAGRLSAGAEKPRQDGRRAWIRARLSVVSPVVWLTSERVTQQALSLILFAVLAPILGPRPYGVFAIVMVFVGFCEWILLEGAVEALVTVDDLEHLHTTAANLTNGVVALVFGLAMSALAPAIAAALHDAEIRNVMWTLAPMPVLSTLSAVPIAVLRRSLKFKQLAIRSILGLTIGGVFGIVLAVAGAGVWALVLQVLAQRIAELVIAWIAVPVRFGVTWSAPHFHELRPVALNVFTARIMTTMTDQLPRLVLGFTLGPTDVGLFALGSRFQDIIVNTMARPRTAVGRIELRAAKIGSAEFQRDFANMVQSASILSFPCYLGTAALAPSLFHLWLNQEWQAGIVPAQLIVLSGVPMVLFYSFDAALLAGNLSSVVRGIAILQGVTLAVTVVCAAPFGLTAACLALAVRPWLLLPFVLMIFRRATNIPGRSTLLPSVRALIGAVIMAGLLTLPFPHPTWMNGALVFALQVIAGIIIYFSYLYCFARGALRSFLSTVLSRRSPTRAVAPKPPLAKDVKKLRV